MEGGEARRAPRHGGVRDQKQERHHRGHLSGSRQYGASICIYIRIYIYN